MTQYKNIFPFFLQWAVLALVFNVLLNASCSKDIITEFPSARLIQAENTLFQDTTLCIEQSFEVVVRMEAGLSKLVEFEIYEDETLMPSNRILIVKQDSVFSSNPRILTGNDQGELEYRISITAPIFHPDSMVTDTVINYFFRTVDDLKQPSVASIAIQYRFPQMTFDDLPDEVVIDRDTLVNLFTGESLDFQIELSDCWKNLEDFSIREDGALVAESRLRIDRVEADTVVGTVTAANPLSIVDEDSERVIYNISIAPADVAPIDQSRTIYSFLLTNVNGQVGVDTITVLNTEGSALVLSVPDTAMLTNQADTIFLRGGLDLDTREEVSLADTAMAELEDEGIILSTRRWRRQISVVHPDDSELRQIRGFTAADFKIQEQLIRAFDRGSSLGGDDDFDSSEVSDKETGEQVSDEIQQGDTFILLRDGIYYFIECTDINPRDGENTDTYEFAVFY